MKKDESGRSAVVAAQKKLLNDRYYLTFRAHPTVKMSRGKPSAIDPTARLKKGTGWADLEKKEPGAIPTGNLFPHPSLPHPLHTTGGQVFPDMQVEMFPPSLVRRSAQAAILLRIFSTPQMHDLHMERSLEEPGDGPIKTFTLRRIQDSPPYLRDGRCLTIEDTVEFFNLVQRLGLNEQEKSDLSSFLRTLGRFAEVGLCLVVATYAYFDSARAKAVGFEGCAAGGQAQAAPQSCDSRSCLEAQSNKVTR